MNQHIFVRDPDEYYDHHPDVNYSAHPKHRLPWHVTGSYTNQHCDANIRHTHYYHGITDKLKFQWTSNICLQIKLRKIQLFHWYVSTCTIWYIDSYFKDNILYHFVKIHPFWMTWFIYEVVQNKKRSIEKKTKKKQEAIRNSFHQCFRGDGVHRKSRTMLKSA